MFFLFKVKKHTKTEQRSVAGQDKRLTEEHMAKQDTRQTFFFFYVVVHGFRKNQMDLMMMRLDLCVEHTRLL